MLIDKVGNALEVGDRVVHFNHLFNVLDVTTRKHYARITLCNPSDTTRPKWAYCKELVVVCLKDKIQSL